MDWGDVSRLRHSFPSPDYFSARFAGRFVFFAHANFFLLFPQRRTWSQANTKPSLWVPINLVPRVLSYPPWNEVGYQSQELRLDLTVKYFFVNLHVHVPGNASIRACAATFLVCDFSISDLGFLVSSRSFPLGHIASFSLSR